MGGVGPLQLGLLPGPPNLPRTPPLGGVFLFLTRELVGPLGFPTLFLQLKGVYHPSFWFFFFWVGPFHFSFYGVWELTPQTRVPQPGVCRPHCPGDGIFYPLSRAPPLRQAFQVPTFFFTPFIVGPLAPQIFCTGGSWFAFLGLCPSPPRLEISPAGCGESTPPFSFQ